MHNAYWASAIGKFWLESNCRTYKIGHYALNRRHIKLCIVHYALRDDEHTWIYIFQNALIEARSWRASLYGFYRHIHCDAATGIHQWGITHASLEVSVWAYSSASTRLSRRWYSPCSAPVACNGCRTGATCARRLGDSSILDIRHERGHHLLFFTPGFMPDLPSFLLAASWPSAVATCGCSGALTVIVALIFVFLQTHPERCFRCLPLRPFATSARHIHRIHDDDNHRHDHRFYIAHGGHRAISLLSQYRRWPPTCSLSVSSAWYGSASSSDGPTVCADSPSPICSTCRRSFHYLHQYHHLCHSESNKINHFEV